MKRKRTARGRLPVLHSDMAALGHMVMASAHITHALSVLAGASDARRLLLEAEGRLIEATHALRQEPP